MIHARRCKKCGELFDIATNFEECPNCRYKKMEENKWIEKTSMKKN